MVRKYSVAEACRREEEKWEAWDSCRRRARRKLLVSEELRVAGTVFNLTHCELQYDM
jgi:hypothetical protein